MERFDQAGRRGLTALLAAACLMPCMLHAQPSDADNPVDLIFGWDGSTRRGLIRAIENDALRVEVPLPGRAGTAEVSIPRRLIKSVSFAERPGEADALATGDIAQLETIWKFHRPFLGMENSDSGAFGLAYGEALLARGGDGDATRALDVFRTIQEEDWNADRQATAGNGRLRALIASGNPEDAINEARELAESSEDPAVLIEAKLVLASAARERLTRLIEENPRWEQDEWIRPERDRLYHEALDHLLFPSLFHGTERAEAARGLWGAVQVYRQAGEIPLAHQCATDLVVLYKDTPEAARASEWLAEVGGPVESHPDADPPKAEGDDA